MLTYAQIKIESAENALALTGLTPKEFQTYLACVLSGAYNAALSGDENPDGAMARQRQAGGGPQDGFGHTRTETLCLRWCISKTYPLQILLGEVFGTLSAPSEYLDAFGSYPSCSRPLKQMGRVFPKRDPQRVSRAAVRQSGANRWDLIIDGTGNGRRPTP